MRRHDQAADLLQVAGLVHLALSAQHLVHPAVAICRHSPEKGVLFKWVFWFKHHVQHKPSGYIPPAEAEANYYLQLASQTVVAV